MSLNAAGIATAIAGLSITGVTVKNITTIPDQVLARDCPLLMPNPSDWIAGGIGGEVSSGQLSFGSAGTWEFVRVFNYLYIRATVGEGRGLKDHFSAMATDLDAITTAITTLNTSTTYDVEQIENSGFATIVDPAGNQFYGCSIAIAMKERINA